MTIVLFYLLSQRQTARTNVMANLKSLNKLPLHLKSGWLEVLELLAFFLLKSGTFRS